MVLRDLEDARLDNEVFVIGPEGFGLPGEENPYDTYAEVAAGFVNYADLLTLVETYADLWDPAGSGGPGGTDVEGGFVFGVSTGFVERWVTGCEGAEVVEWQTETVDPALSDGTWHLGSRLRGREVTIESSFVSHGAADRDNLRLAIERFSRILTGGSRWGWLTWISVEEIADGSGGVDRRNLVRRLPVTVAEPSKVKWSGSRLVETQLVLKGVDVGTPGKGVWWEDVQVVP